MNNIVDKNKIIKSCLLKLLQYFSRNTIFLEDPD